SAGEAARPAKFKLAYRNAISVMPETFRLTVQVNDVVIGETAVQNANQTETLSLNVPVGILQAGFNSVRVKVRQTHRVDCSVDSTYELWTQLMQDQSAFTFTGGSGEIRSLQDLPAIQPSRDGTTSIRVRTPSNRETAGLNQASRAVQSAVMFGRFAHPRVELASEMKNEAGLDIVVGTAPEIQRSTGLKVPGMGARHQLQHNVQNGSVVLVATGDTDAEVDLALDALSHQAQQIVPQGSPAGLRALKNVSGRQVGGGETVTLAELGADAEPFRGRLQRQTFQIQMPGDLLAADYDRVTVAADAVYAPGLLPTSKMVISVNGTQIANAPLANSAGDVLSKRDFHLPISTFKPGLNTIDVEAETRTGSDEKCSLEALIDQRERFLLSGTSQITIPALGRIGALPNISSVIPGGLARLSGSNELMIFVPKGRHEAVEAALTALAKMASVSSLEAKARFTFDVVPAGTPHVLAFGAYDDMPEATLRAAGLDPDKLRRAWRQPATNTPDVAVLKNRVQVASMGDAVEFASNLPNGRMNVESTASLPAASSLENSPPVSGMSKVFDGTASDWLRGYSLSSLETVSSFISDTVSHTGIIAKRPRADLPLTDGSTLVVAQGARSDGIVDGWRAKLLPSVNSTTVFVAPTAEDLSRSVGDLLTGSLWQQFVGDAAVYTARDGAISTRVSGEILLVPTAALSLQNVRLIAAGWLSRNIPVYLAVLLGLFVVMTAFMQWVLRSSGVRES
ncbi:MAG TPA: cellulose biosynthesis cyclic di-GMP-binding regulatory protein BcsB, partial [Microvirga sp.]|nr:cellulose biosynthesis cyclic di-GMP-binding regulatory protein BcsB [Microvirga sp.]